MVTAVAFLLGIHLVMAIGGADMPVVVSMLNSYSGWAAAAAGFMLENDLLIITGALVGSSGAILSYIMCHAMNRSFLSVILGGFGAEEGAAPGGASAQPAGEVKAVTAEETADLLRDAKSVVIVPGYGMAVAQAQYPLYEVTKLPARQGRQRPVRDPSGGGPAARPHERAARRSEGAVRHRARDGRDQRGLPRDRRRDRDRRQRHRQSGRARRSVSPIYGMPILEVWKAKTCVVMKRGMASGYAGVDNPLFYKENTRMLFGDAKKMIDAVLTSLKTSA